MNTSRPNILLIMTDQQSADAMSCEIGDAHINTPSMDGIASSGLRFTKAYCGHPLCVPSRASMFTGRYPHETGVLANNDLERDLSAFPCLGSIFRDSGYDTGYVGKWHLPYPIDNSAGHGFSYRANNISNGADHLNSKQASEFLREQRTAPFLLVVSYNNPHNICEWARGERGSLPDGVINDPPPFERLPPLKPNSNPQVDEPDTLSLLRRSYHASPTFPVGDFGEREWREYLWAYYRMVESVDKHIGVLLETLETTGLEENTAVVFISDHGDSQGAHFWNQKTVLYDESARVPCIVSYPRRVDTGISNALVQTGIDLIPTLCDIAGITLPPDLPGKSMLDSANEVTDDRERSYVVTQTRFIQGAELGGSIPEVEGRMLRSERYKYCVYDRGEHRESLVDMERDPGETINLARKSEYIPVLEEHRRYMKAYSSKRHDPFPFVMDAE